MATFDRELWQFRAEARHDRLVKAGKLDRAQDQLAIDMLAIRGLETVIRWCNHRRLPVSFVRAPNATYYYRPKKIEVCGKMLPEAQLFLLLHECGHHLVDQGRDGGSKPKKEREPPKRTYVQRVQVVEEELAAWDEGLGLAQQLQIYINHERWTHLRAKLLNSYFLWVTQRK